MNPEFSPNRRPSESLTERAVAGLMDTYIERLFVHGKTRQRPARLKEPREVQYDFNATAVQRLLERTSQDDGVAVAEAYAIYEREGKAAESDSREAQGESVVIIINKRLTASPAHNPIYQNTWYTFTSVEAGRVQGAYEYEFLQGGRPIMNASVATSLEERLVQAMRGSSDRHRLLFEDDAVFLRELLDQIGR